EILRGLAIKSATPLLSIVSCKGSQSSSNLFSWTAAECDSFSTPLSLVLKVLSLPSHPLMLATVTVVSCSRALAMISFPGGAGSVMVFRGSWDDAGPRLRTMPEHFSKSAGNDGLPFLPPRSLIMGKIEDNQLHRFTKLILISIGVFLSVCSGNKVQSAEKPS